jgi:hypothetical protein
MTGRFPGAKMLGGAFHRGDCVEASADRPWGDLPSVRGLAEVPNEHRDGKDNQGGSAPKQKRRSDSEERLFFLGKNGVNHVVPVALQHARTAEEKRFQPFKAGAKHGKESRADNQGDTAEDKQGESGQETPVNDRQKRFAGWGQTCCQSGC